MILRTFARGAITSFGRQCSKIITSLSLSLSRSRFKEASSLLATMSKRATISKFSQCWKASRVERHSSLSHKWCSDSASTECTGAVITGIARPTTNPPLLQKRRVNPLYLASSQRRKTRWRKKIRVEDRIAAWRRTQRIRLFPFSSSFQPSWGANVNTGFADFEWLLHVTALCEFPSCRATTSFASRLVIKITDRGGEGVYARCYAQVYTRANPIGIRIESSTKRNDGGLVSYFASKLEGVALQFIPPPTFLSFLRWVFSFIRDLSTLVIRLRACWDGGFDGKSDSLHRGFLIGRQILCGSMPREREREFGFSEGVFALSFSKMRFSPGKCVFNGL